MGIEQLSTIWPEWSVVEQIGEGSFGKVYKVVREGHGITDYAAVKVITIPQNPAELNSLRADGYDETSARSYFGSIVTDFVNEIKLMTTMKGTSNIVSVEDYKVVEKTDEVGWDIYIRMELLTSFVDYTMGKNLSQDEVIKLGKDVCSALELCARKKIIHRDIKPENIFVSSFGDFKLGDFGIARELEKTSGSMSAKGTYNYIAPEVTIAKKYDATVDIYSLGLVLYKLLNNNRLPFVDPYAEQILYQDRKEAVDRRLSGEVLPLPVHASPELGYAIVKACQYDPSLRFRTATEFKQALEAAGHMKQEAVVGHIPQGAAVGQMPQGTAAGHMPHEAVVYDTKPLDQTVRLIDDGTAAGRRAPMQTPIDKTLREVSPYFPERPDDTANFGKKESKPIKKLVIVASIICVCIIVLVVIITQFLNGNDTGEYNAIDATPERTVRATTTPPPESEPDPDPVPEELSINIEHEGVIVSEISLISNTAIELTAVVEPHDTEYIVAWTSSDTSVFNVIATGNNGRTAVLEGVSAGDAELTVIIGSIVHHINVFAQPPSFDDTDLRQIYEKVSNIGTDSVTFSFSWLDGRSSSLISNYTCNCPRFNENHIWFFYGANGHNRCVFPEYGYEENTLVISWPEAAWGGDAPRSYYLSEDGTGFFAEEDRTTRRGDLTWEFRVNR